MSNHTFRTSPVAVLGESTSELRISCKSVADIGGWCSLQSFPDLRRLLMTDMNTPLLGLKVTEFIMSSFEKWRDIPDLKAM